MNRGCDGNWLSSALHRSTRDIKQPGIRDVQVPTSVPRIHWMRYGVLLRWETAFTVWKSYPAVTDAFLQLATTPTPLVSEACMIYLERFVILLYDRTSNKANVKEPGSSCLHKKAERMMQFHQLGRPCYSIQRELLIKVVTVGAKHLHQTLIYLHEAIGAGFSRKENGSLSGRLFQT